MSTSSFALPCSLVTMMSVSASELGYELAFLLQFSAFILQGAEEDIWA
jgi:hypothetical protein